MPISDAHVAGSLDRPRGRRFGDVPENEIESDQLVSVFTLIDREAERYGTARMREWITNYDGESIRNLLITLSTASNPLVLWFVHCRLDQLDIPPCLRVKRNDTPQMEYITLLADMLWVAKRKKGHVPAFKRWRVLFATDNPVSCRTWHDRTLWVYRNAYKKAGLLGKGLGLTDAERQLLLVVVTSKAQNERRRLVQLPELEEKLLVDSVCRPDKS